MSAFTYADTSSWQEWQREYRYGAFYIFPPRGLIEAIDHLRQLHDPRSAAYCQAHISLSEPLPRALDEPELDEIRHSLATIAPLTIRYGPLRGFLPYPGVALAIAPEDRFRALRVALHATPAFAGAAFSREQIAPHMTIAEFITVEETGALLRELSESAPQGTFLCDTIEYAIPDDAFSFQRALTISLGTDG